MTKRIILILISLVIAFAGVGNVMPARREMNQLEVVRIMGIDRTSDGEVEVTLVRNYANSEVNGGVGGEEEGGEDEEDAEQGEGAETAAGAAGPPGNTISRRGATVSGALNEIRRAMEREVLGSHIQFILIGEDAARKDILAVTDFLSRDMDARLSAKVFFVEGGSARELLEQLPPEFILADKLSNFGRHSGVSNISKELTLADFFRKLSSESGDVLVPNVRLSSLNGSAVAELGGYTIVANRRFAGIMDERAAAGYNLIARQDSAGYVDVRLSASERYASVRITDFRTRVQFEFEDDELRRIRVATEIRGNVNEAQVSVDSEVLREIEMLVAAKFYGQMRAAIELSQRYESDFLEFGERLRMRHPVRWERIRADLRGILAAVDVSVTVEVEIWEGN